MFVLKKAIGSQDKKLVWIRRNLRLPRDKIGQCSVLSFWEPSLLFKRRKQSTKAKISLWEIARR